MSLSRILREPLLHFALLGLALFLIYRAVAPDGGDARRIVLSRAEVAALGAQYAALWGRPPNAAERRELIEDYVRDEIAYREGVAAGLDRDDAVIKRRVRQKYELIAEESAAATPTEADLAAYLAANPDRFRQPPKISFTQIYFDPARSPPQALAAARAAIVRGADPAGFGEATLLPQQMEAAPEDAVARDFGPEFAAALLTLPVGEWTGPVRSALGDHLVRVTARAPAAMPALAQVRAEVARAWEADRRRAALEADYARLRAEYDVVIENAP